MAQAWLICGLVAVPRKPQPQLFIVPARPSVWAAAAPMQLIREAQPCNVAVVLMGYDWKNRFGESRA